MTATDPRADKQDIAEVLVRYATGIDRRDWQLFRTCFTDDVLAEYGGIGTWEDVDTITEWMTANHADVGLTLHRLSNLTIDVAGDAATARSYVDAVLMATDGETGVNACGFYDDDLVRTPEGWRIRHRRYTMVNVAGIGS